MTWTPTHIKGPNGLSAKTCDQSQHIGFLSILAKLFVCHTTNCINTNHKLYQSSGSDRNTFEGILSLNQLWWIYNHFVTAHSINFGRNSFKKNYLSKIKSSCKNPYQWSWVEGVRVKNSNFVYDLSRTKGTNRLYVVKRNGFRFLKTGFAISRYMVLTLIVFK